ncbi:MAG: DUF3188 domain-containing protein [Cyanobacteria bacterium J06638_7]
MTLKPVRPRPLLDGLLVLSAPLLIVLALVVLLQRQGRDRIQAVPALLIGGGLLVASQLRRQRRRRALLLALRQERG